MATVANKIIVKLSYSNGFHVKFFPNIIFMLALINKCFWANQKHFLY